MASLRALPALKAGTFWAAIFIFWPVWGFVPSLALRSLTENLPKPVIWTSSPALSASVTTSSKASKCFWASLLGAPVSLAILSITFFFMITPFCGRVGPLDEPVWVAYCLFIRDSEPLATPAFPAALAQWMLWGCGAGRTDRSRLPRFLLHQLAPLLHLLLYLLFYLLAALLHLLLYLLAPLLYFL